MLQIGARTIALLALFAGACSSDGSSTGTTTGAGGAAVSTGAGGAGGASTTSGGGGPTLLEPYPTAIAVDETSVYWLDRGCERDAAVMRMPLGGGDPVKLATGSFDARALVVDATHVYWTGDRAVKKVPVDGGAAVTLAQVDSPHEVGAIAVDATSVYWEDFDESLVLGSVKRTPLGGGTSATLASGQSVRALVADGSSVYWTNGAEGTVMRVDVGGGVPTMVAWGQYGPERLALDATNVYWTADDAVVRAPREGGTPLTIVEGRGHPLALAVDATHVYWTELDTVMKAPVEGGTPLALASGEHGPVGLAVDATHVHWGRPGSAESGCAPGAIMRAPIEGGVGVAPPNDPPPYGYPAAMTIDATNVYWVEPGNGVVMKETLDGATRVTLATHQRPGAIAVDATDVYWTNGGNGTVMKVAKDGGAPTDVAVAQPGPSAITLSSTHVAWMTSRDVRTLASGGGTPGVLATLPFSVACGLSPGALVADATNVYWMSLGTEPDCTATVMTASLGGGAPTPAAAGQARTHDWKLTPISPMAFAVDATSLYFGDYDVGTGNGAVMKVGLSGGAPVTLASGPWGPSAIVVDGASVYWTQMGLSNVVLMRVALDGGTPTELATLESGDVHASLAVDAARVYWMRPGLVATVVSVPK